MFYIFLNSRTVYIFCNMWYIKTTLSSCGEFYQIKNGLSSIFFNIYKKICYYSFSFSAKILSKTGKVYKLHFSFLAILGILYFRFCKNMVDNKAPVFSHGCAFLRRLSLNSFAFSASAAGGSSIHAIRDTAEMRAAASDCKRLRANPTVCEHSTIYRLSPPFSHSETLTIPCQNDIIV